MAQNRNDRKGWSHASGVYRRFTLVHFAYALVLSVPAALMLLALDLELVMVGLVIAEVLAFLLLPHVGWVRRAVDARIAARARAEASMARAVLLLRMSDAHRRELNSLERIAAALRERADMSPNADDCMGVERLIELYVRLAIAHRASCASLDVVGNARLDEELAALEARAAGENRSQREWLDRRLAILRMRRDARRAALDEQTAITHDLAMISDTLRWMQENCAASGAEALRAELEFALASRERDAATLRELSSLRETEFDASVIRLGREPAPARPDHPHLRVAVPSREGTTDDGLGIVISEPAAEPANEDAITVRIWPSATAREAS
jgi:hypothetical protein